MGEEENEAKERATETYSVKCSGFPKELWLEWEADCKRKYGDCRWMKMWYDHLRAKELDRFEVVFQKIVELELKLKKLEEKLEKPKETEVATLGGG